MIEENCLYQPHIPCNFVKYTDGQLNHSYIKLQGLIFITS